MVGDFGGAVVGPGLENTTYWLRLENFGASPFRRGRDRVSKIMGRHLATYTTGREVQVVDAAAIEHAVLSIDDECFRHRLWSEASREVTRAVPQDREAHSKVVPECACLMRGYERIRDHSVERHAPSFRVDGQRIEIGRESARDGATRFEHDEHDGAILRVGSEAVVLTVDIEKAHIQYARRFW